MQTFGDLKRNLKKNFSGLPTVKVAVLGDTATQLLCQALRGAGFNYGFDLQIWEADFNQIEQQVYSRASELYAFEPDVILIFHSSHKLLTAYNKIGREKYHSLADERLLLISNLVSAIRTSTSAKIIYFNHNEIDDGVFGSFSNKTEQSFLYQLRKLNYKLMEYASQATDFYLCDIAGVQNQLGKGLMFNPAIYVNTDMVLSIDALPVIANRTLDLIGATYGKFKKCVIVDLDNTLWGGIIGDDGAENIQIGNLGIGKAFTEFQYWLKKLKNRGIILAVCSKNTDAIAREPFENHPDMVLKMDDFAVFMANWDNKADNIRKIQAILNIGFDSMVFLDDNPFERNFVKEAIGNITVPELPEDPADYLEYLYSLNLFESVSFTDEDNERTKRYQEESNRAIDLGNYADEDDFLKSLNMICEVNPFNKFNTPRVAQLTQRSNQFNLRTVRYSESEIAQMAEQDQTYTFAFRLTDRFGDHGLISAIILRHQDQDVLFIDTWLMSCRVLKRGMEHFALNAIAEYARSKNVKHLKGEYLRTEKNSLVESHYSNLGFVNSEGYWLLDLEQYHSKRNFINQSE